MSEVNRDGTKGALGFFILSALEKQPLPVDAIEHRMQRIVLMFELAAKRNRRSGPESLDTALNQLMHAGWLEVFPPQIEIGGKKIYSLSITGRKELEAERERRTANLAGTIENGALDNSFRKFLDRNI